MPGVRPSTADDLAHFSPPPPHPFPSSDYVDGGVVPAPPHATSGHARPTDDRSDDSSTASDSDDGGFHDIGAAGYADGDYSGGRLAGQPSTMLTVPVVTGSGGGAAAAAVAVQRVPVVLAPIAGLVPSFDGTVGGPAQFVERSV